MNKAREFLIFAAIGVAYVVFLFVAGWIGQQSWNPVAPDEIPHDTVECAVPGVTYPWEMVAYINRCPN